jgi:integrase
VLLAAFTGLRWGELAALRHSDLDLERGTVTVSRKFAEQRWTPGRRSPKSTAGVRVVALPAIIGEVMKAHLVDFPAEGEELVFRGPLGASLRRNTSTGRFTGPRSSLRLDCQPDSTSMISAIRATTWRRRAARALES